MKTVFLRFSVIITSFVFSQLQAQVYNYTWMKGAPNTSVAVYGTKGVSSPSNNPGSQGNGITWTDQAGNLWLYGGYGMSGSGWGSLSDLWKYSPATNNWTWVNGTGNANVAPVHGTIGVSSSSNTPGVRIGSASWTDASGNLWLFGGTASAGPYNDLWRYNVSNNQWTWMGGNNTANASPVYGTMSVPATTNIPGASTFLVSWKDPSGNFWLYDGYKGTEVWKYNPSNAQWAWVSGASIGTVAPTYGTMGVSSTTAHPGGRFTEGVSDAAGNLYIFGGYVTSATGTRARNDLWKYNIINNQWTWLSGSQMTNQVGTYGTQGVFTSSSVPSCRGGHVMWADNNNNKIWLFGGGYLSLVSNYWLNDTWCFNVTTGQWAWMKGSNVAFSPSSPGPGAVYGTQTVASSSNTPGWVEAPAYWPGDPYTLWIYSGYGYSPSTELWRFNACTITPTVSISSSHSVLCAGSTATLTAFGSSSSFSWNTGAQTNTLSVSPSSTTVYYISNTGSNCASSTAFTLPVQSVSITLQNPTIPMCSGNSYVLSANAASSYSWSTGATSQTAMVIPSASTVYSLSAINGGCALTATYALNVSPSPTLSITASANSVCAGQSATLSVTGSTSFSWSTGQTGSVAVVMPLTNSNYSVYGTSTSSCPSFAQYSLAVTPYPILSVISSPSLSCAGSTVALSASGAGSYSWSTGQTGYSLQVSPLATSVYTVTGTTNGCSSNKTFTQQVQPLPALTISSSTNQICKGQSVVLTASGASGYTWSTGQTVASFSTSPLATTIYTVTGTSNGCSNTGTFTQQVLPLPTLTVSGAVNIICKGETLTLTVSGANTYIWNVTGANGNVLQVSPLVTTFYGVEGTDSNGCKNSAIVTVNVSECLDVKEISNGNSFNIFPNPSLNSFNIKGGTGRTLKIFNLSGQIVFEQKLESETTTIYAHLSSGIYYCTLSGIENTAKLIIE
jgi:hypothetical protein